MENLQHTRIYDSFIPQVILRTIIRVVHGGALSHYTIVARFVVGYHRLLHV